MNMSEHMPQDPVIVALFMLASSFAANDDTTCPAGSPPTRSAAFAVHPDFPAAKGWGGQFETDPPLPPASIGTPPPLRQELGLRVSPTAGVGVLRQDGVRGC